MIHPHLILAVSENPVVQIANQFGIQWQFLFAQAFSFAVVAFLLYKLAFKPVIATIDERQTKIAAGLQYAEEMKISLAESEKRQEEILRNASIQATKMIDEARATSKELVERQTREATERGEEILRKANEATQMERKKIMAEARQEIARLVVATSTKVLARELTEEQRTTYSAAATRELTNV
jgi:F-type H+-transporting ATPase subunit b